MTAPTDFPIVVSQGSLLGGPGGDLLIQIVAGLAVAGLGFLFGWNQRNIYDVKIINANPELIYEIIHRFAGAARGARSNELKQKVEDLIRKIDEYLGAVILIGKDMGGPLKELKSALEGKVDEPAKPVVKDEPRTQTCGCGGNGTPRGCSCSGSGHGVPAQPVSINQIYIGGVPTGPAPGAVCDRTPSPCDAPIKDPKGEKPADKPATVKRDMTGTEQIEALDKAVRAFNDYWGVKETRIAELRAAQQALLRRPPTAEVKPPSPVPVENSNWPWR